MGEIQNLSKQVYFNNFIYYFKDKNGPKNLIFWSPAAFYKAGYLTLEKAEEKQKKVE